MALDTNIALGVKPIEQPNMLAQMGQMMQLRQMQQENESNNALRDFYAQGGDINKAEDRQRLLSRAPMQGQKILGQESERRARDVTTLGKEYENARVGLTNVNDETGYYNWVQSSFNNPAIAAHLNQMGITPEKALANARATVAKEGLSTAIAKSSMGISEFIKQDLQLQNATKNANIAAAPGHRQASVAEQRFKNELDFGGETKPFAIQDPNNPKQLIEVEHRRDKRTGQWVPMGIQAPPLSVNISPSSASATMTAPISGGGGTVNNLAPSAANVNAMNPNAPVVAANVPAPALAVVRGGAPTLTEIANPDNPMETMRVDARIYKGGGPNSPGVLGIVKTGNLNPAQQQKLKTEMAKDFKAVDKTIAETNALLESIDAVRNSNLERVAGPIDARTFTMTNEGKLAETRFENLKGKVTAIAKTASTMTGAIGSIANQEWQILANQIAVLDLKNGKEPSLEQIDQLERQALSIANRMRAGFERQYGEHLDDLGPQYKNIPNVTYTPGSAGYTPTGKKTPARNSATPASTGNITDNADVAKVIEFGSLKK